MADGITRLAVEGFKSISTRQEIEIAPLTVLAGANSSGKSSIMQPLLMLKQTLDQVTDPGPLWIGGPNVQFTSGEQFFSRNASPRLSIEIASGTSEFAIVFRKGERFAAEVVEEVHIVKGMPALLRPEMATMEIQQLIEGLYGFRDNSAFEYFLVPNRFFLDVQVKGGPSFQIMEGVGPLVQGVIHVPGRRANPGRTYPVRAVRSTFPGTFEPYTASAIDSWQTEKDARYCALNDDLKHTGLAERVIARRLNAVEIDVLVNRVRGGDADDMVSIADVGFGVSQILPVLVALRAAEPGQLVYLEEPEADLHPRAQVKLADVLAGAAQRGVRVVAETHSTLLLTAIQTLVARVELASEHVKLHWFQRDPETGTTSATTADLDENGAFGEWPEDFGHVILKAEGAYLDAVEGRQVR